MADIRIYRLPKTTDPTVLEAQSRSMRVARLRSLQSDPQSFKSRYEDEILQPTAFWHDRLKPENVQHFVAISSSTEDTETPEYKAFMVVIADDIKGQHDVLSYFLGAFWVDPETRNQKIGSRIVDASIIWLKNEARARGWTQVHYRLNVAPDNHRAISLYKRLGFEIVEKQQRDDDGFLSMAMTIDVS